jgi:hypothetical protein
VLIAVGVIVVLVVVGTLVPKRDADKATGSELSTAVATITASATAAAPEPSTTTEAPAPQRPLGYVSEATWTDQAWPFTVPEGVIKCNEGPMVGSVQMEFVLFRTDRGTYAVNGAAKGWADKMGWQDLDAIRAAYPDDPQTMVNTQAIIDRGLALCDG